jgi:hypothetical protein
MDAMPSITKQPRLGPYSKTLDRGAVGAKIDARSREGRFLRSVERQLVTHVGGEPSATQSVLIRRASRAIFRLELLDEKLTQGDFTDHDGRVYSALSNALRLAIKELGLKNTPREKAPTLAAIAARHRSPGA